MRKLDGRKLCTVQNLIGISVADPAHDTRVRERPLQGTVFSRERGLKRRQIAGENFDAARIDGTQSLLTLENMQGGAALGTRFGQHQRAMREIKSRQLIAPGQLCSSRPPM